MAYSESPVRNSVRVIVTSVNSIGSRPAELSMVRPTSARPRAGRLAVPAKMTSSIFWLRTAEGAWAPSTQPMASTTLDLPEPLGPTTTVMPGSRSRTVGSAKDLKPFRVRRLEEHLQPRVEGATEPTANPRPAGARMAPDMRKYVIMGVQGSGKGTQAKLLADDLDLVHIGVGDIFRWNMQHHTKLGAQVRRTMAAGEPRRATSWSRPSSSDRLAGHDWNFGFIIDGFPRNVRQAEFFLEGYDIDGVIVLELPDEEVARRVLSRRLCSTCGLDYNLMARGQRSTRPLRRLPRPARRPARRHARGAGRPAAATTTRRPGRSSSCSTARSSSPTSTPPRASRTCNG